MANVQGQYKLVEQNYGQDVLNLVLAQRYLEKLLANKMVGCGMARASIWRILSLSSPVKTLFRGLLSYFFFSICCS